MATLSDRWIKGSTCVSVLSAVTEHIHIAMYIPSTPLHPQHLINQLMYLMFLVLKVVDAPPGMFDVAADLFPSSVSELNERKGRGAVHVPHTWEGEEEGKGRTRVKHILVCDTQHTAQEHTA